MEIGKRYIYNKSGVVYTCVYIAGDGRPVLESEKHNIFRIYDENDYTEYTSPKTGIAYICIYQSSAGIIHSVSDANSPPLATFDVLARLEVPWVEGQGLK